MATITHWFLSSNLKSRLSGIAVLSACLFGGTPDRAAAKLSSSRSHNACHRVAFAGLQAALTGARADFELAIGKCLNREGGFGRCIREHRQEYREAKSLARQQYRAKLDVCRLVGCGPFDPEVDPDDFSSTVDNPYFPLVPGRTLVYQKTTDEGVETIRVTTLSETIEIAGVECAIVHDVVDLDGELVEDTDDWYSQRENGDVWYLGEIAHNFEDGLLDNLDGSWKTGKEGAKPGILMKASPRPGDAYRQEFLLNEAEDVGVVISLGETVSVAYGTFTNCLQTEDYTPLEPGVREWKFYAPGIGLVLELNPDTGERTELVAIIDA